MDGKVGVFSALLLSLAWQGVLRRQVRPLKVKRAVELRHRGGIGVAYFGTSQGGVAVCPRW